MARKEKKDTRSVMLAPNSMIPFDDPRIEYPIFASNKLDGNRCFVRSGDLLTRHMLNQPNPKLIQFMRGITTLANDKDLCFDGELLIPNASHHGVHGQVFNSSVNAKDIPEGTQFHVFDVFTRDDWEKGSFAVFEKRVELYHKLIEKLDDPRFVAMEQRSVESPEEAQADFERAIDQGYEGIMLRHKASGYKQGRCGHKGAWLLKFKAEETQDGQIVEVVQQLKMREGIERTRNSFGRLEQPTKNADNYTTTDSVGSFKVKTEDGTVSEIMFAEGVADHAQRKQWWKERKSLIGRWLEFKSYPGGKDGIRSGRMIRWRDDKKKG